MLTRQQREQLLLLAQSAVEDLGDEHAEQALCNFVEALAEARVVVFAECALRAPNVPAHLRNTLEQYTVLGFNGVKP